MKSEFSSAKRACFWRAASSRSAGPLPRVGDRQRRGQHQHLAHAALGVGLQNHPAQPRVDGQARQATAEVGDRALLIEGAELLQQLHAVADTASVRRVEEREVLHLAELQRRHLQNAPRRGWSAVSRDRCSADGRRSPPRNTGGCTHRAPPGRTGRHAARPTPARPVRSATAAPSSAGCSAKCGRCPGRRRSGSRARSATSRRRWSPARRGARCAVRTPSAARRSAAARRAGAPRCVFSPAKASAVSRISRSPDRNTSTSPGGSASSSWIASTIASISSRISVRTISWSGSSGSSSLSDRTSDFQWPITDFDGIRPPGHLDDRRTTEMGGKPLRLDRRRCDDHLQVRAARQQLT